MCSYHDHICWHIWPYSIKKKWTSPILATEDWNKSESRGSVRWRLMSKETDVSKALRWNDKVDLLCRPASLQIDTSFFSHVFYHSSQ